MYVPRWYKEEVRKYIEQLYNVFSITQPNDRKRKMCEEENTNEIKPPIKRRHGNENQDRQFTNT
jgi:hypothetical protein